MNDEINKNIMVLCRQRGAALFANRLVDAGLVSALAINKCLSDTLEELKNPEI